MTTDPKALEAAREVWAAADLADTQEEAIAIIAAALARPTPKPAGDDGRLQRALDFLAENKSRSLSFDGKTFCEDDNSDLWVVTEVRGGMNDREWVVLGSGSTPSEALLAASPSPANAAPASEREEA